MIELLRLRKDEAGSTAIEFAIVATTLLIIIFGIVDIGRALYAYDWVADAARQGTRFAIVRGQTCSGLSSGCPAQASDVNAYVAGLTLGIDSGQVTVTSGCYLGSTYVSALPCATPESVQVQVQYNFKFLSPLAYRSWTMRSTSQRVVQD